MSAPNYLPVVPHDFAFQPPDWPVLSGAHGVRYVEAIPHGFRLRWPWGCRLDLCPPAFAPDDEQVEWVRHRIATHMPDVWSGLVDYTDRATYGQSSGVGVYWRMMARRDPEMAQWMAKHVSGWSAADLGAVKAILGVRCRGGQQHPDGLRRNAAGLAEATGIPWEVDGATLRSVPLPGGQYGSVGWRLDGRYHVDFFNGWGVGGISTTSWAEVEAWLLANFRDFPPATAAAEPAPLLA